MYSLGVRLCWHFSFRCFFFFSSSRRHTRCLSDWSSDVCSSDLSGDRQFFGNLRAVDAGVVQVRQHFGQNHRSFLRRTIWLTVPASLSNFTTDQKSTRLNSSHLGISYAVFCLKKNNR